MLRLIYFVCSLILMSSTKLRGAASGFGRHSGQGFLLPWRLGGPPEVQQGAQRQMGAGYELGPGGALSPHLSPHVPQMPKELGLAGAVAPWFLFQSPSPLPCPLTPASQI